MRITVAFQQSGPTPEIVRIAQLAESLGFDGLWLNDAQSHWRDVYVCLGAVGASTSRILVGPGVTNIATRHLAVTASAMYSLNELCGGRARMGIGTGAAAVEDAGEKPARMADLEKAAVAIRALWAGHEVAVNGKASRLEYAVSAPRAIPVYLAASGPRLIEFSGRIADGLLCNVGAEPEQIAKTVQSARDAARSAGRDPASLEVAARVPACIGDEADAARYVRARVGITALRRDPAEFSPQDRRALEKIRQSYDPRQHLRLDAAYAQEVTESLINKFALAGTPEACVEKIRQLSKTGINELNLAFMHPDTEMLLRTFAGRIMPRL